MRWPDGKYGNSYGGWGNTFEEACANQNRVHQEQEDQRYERLKAHGPTVQDIADDGQRVRIGWRMANGEWVDGWFSFRSWHWAPASVREQLNEWGEPLNPPRKNSSVIDRPFFPHFSAVVMQSSWTATSRSRRSRRWSLRRVFSSGSPRRYISSR